MRVIKLYEEFNKYQIATICAKYGIENYTINPDGSIDVDGDVYFNNQDLYKLPLKFNKVSGHFYCYDSSLFSLEGSPREVGGDFYCSTNRLKTLEGCPDIVGGFFNCNNNIISTLEYCPKKVNDFSCNNNSLYSLEGLTTNIGNHFSCESNPVWEIWKLINDDEHLELFLDYDIVRDGNTIILDRLNDLLDLIGKPKVTSVKGYKCI